MEPDVSLPDGVEYLPDGSLVVGDRYELRYRRQSAEGTAAPKVGDHRSPTERDRGRLGYSAYLRRLAGVTQVVSPDLLSSQMHSRASHSHKVAMIAREIADHINRSATSTNPEWMDVIVAAGGLDIAACEAAGLAHDIGHPPFGHAGEDALDDFLLERTNGDGFEGNAQTFRTVTRLDRLKGLAPLGLDLTNVTLAAILKYPRLREQPYREEENRKFGAYLADEPLLRAVRNDVLGISDASEDDGRQTLEASVMDLADDIAYAIHDLEDFLAAGLIDVGAVRSSIVAALEDAGVNPEDPRTLPDAAFAKVGKSVFTAAAAKHRAKYHPLFNDADYAAALDDVAQFLGQLGDPEDLNYVVTLRMLLAEFIESFFKAINVSTEPQFEGGPSVYLESVAWHQMQVLKSVTRQFLVSRPKMGMMQRGQAQAVQLLLTGLARWLCTAPKRHSLPPAFLHALDRCSASIPETRTEETALTESHYRAIADYVCTMSDSEALMRSQWLMGTEVPGSFRLAMT